jgi:hypothetical protein
MTNEESAELSQPGVCAFDGPASFAAPELSAVLVSPVLAALAVGNDEVDAALLQPFPQRIGVVGAIGDHTFWPLPRTAFRSGDADLGEHGFRKRNVSRRGAFQPNSQWKTLAACMGRHRLAPAVGGRAVGEGSAMLK